MRWAKPPDLPASSSGSYHRSLSSHIAGHAKRGVVHHAKLLFAEPPREVQPPRKVHVRCIAADDPCKAGAGSGDRLLLAVGGRMFVVPFIERSHDPVHVRHGREVFVHEGCKPSAHRRKRCHAEEIAAGESGVDEFAGEQALGIGIAAVCDGAVPDRDEIGSCRTHVDEQTAACEFRDNAAVAFQLADATSAPSDDAWAMVTNPDRPA